MSFASLAGWVAMAENDQNAWEECCSRAKQDTEVYSHACISPVVLNRSHWGESEIGASLKCIYGCITPALNTGTSMVATSARAKRNSGR